MRSLQERIDEDPGLEVSKDFETRVFVNSLRIFNPQPVNDKDFLKFVSSNSTPIDYQFIESVTFSPKKPSRFSEGIENFLVQKLRNVNFVDEPKNPDFAGILRFRTKFFRLSRHSLSYVIFESVTMFPV